MNVVRSAKSGMRSRSLWSRSMVYCRGGRRIASSTRLEMCYRGMSMYLHTLGFRAISSISSSEKYDGYAYNMRSHRMPGISDSSRNTCASPFPSNRSYPYWLVSSAMRFNSTTPFPAKTRASETKSRHGLDRNFPRKPGMAQNVHAWLQPSATRKYALCRGPSRYREDSGRKGTVAAPT